MSEWLPKLEALFESGGVVQLESNHGTFRGELTTDAEHDYWQVGRFGFWTDEVLGVHDRVIEVD